MFAIIEGFLLVLTTANLFAKRSCLWHSWCLFHEICIYINIFSTLRYIKHALRVYAVHAKNDVTDLSDIQEQPLGRLEQQH